MFHMWVMFQNGSPCSNHRTHSAINHRKFRSVTDRFMVETAQRALPLLQLYVTPLTYDS